MNLIPRFGAIAPALVTALACGATTLLLATAPAASADGSRVLISAGGGSAFEPSPPLAVVVALSQPTHFQLSNGAAMRLEARGSSLRMRYSGRQAVLLRPDDQNQFISDDRQLTLAVQVDDYGDARQARLSMPASWQ